MNLPSSWDRGAARGFRLSERRDHSFGVGDLRLARREDPVDDPDLLRVNAHLSLEAEAEGGAGRDFEPLLVSEIDPNRVEGCLDAGGARRCGDPGAGKGQLCLSPAPRHVHVERKIASAERDMPDPRAPRESVRGRRDRAPSR
jgi:hypothetical protein